MKRILVLLLSVLVVFCLAGCDFSDEEKDKDEDVAVETGVITVKATYTGTAADATAPGSKKIYVYLYKTLSANAQDASAPDYSLSTDAAVAIGVESTITIADIAPGEYSVVVFYDYKTHNLNIAGKDDRYVIYDAGDTVNYTTNIVSEADKISVGNDSSDTITVTFGDDYKLDSDGAFDL